MMRNAMLGLFLCLMCSRIWAENLGNTEECQHGLDRVNLDREEELAMNAVEKRAEFKQLALQADKGWHIYIHGQLKSFSKVKACLWEVEVSTQYKDEAREARWNTYLVSRTQKVMYKYDSIDGEYKKIK